MTTRILVVEDSAAIRRMIGEHLRAAGYQVYEAWSLGAARKLLPSVRPAILLLDLQLEDGEAFSLLAEMASAPVSTIIVSMRQDPADRMRCFQLGADDYIVKPFAPPELLARIRRLETLTANRAVASVVDCGAFLLDFAHRRVIYPAGGGASLSRSEFALLGLLMEAGEEIVSRALIMERIFAKPLPDKSRAVDVLVSKLRRKLDPEAVSSPIWSVRGDGYRFTARRQPASS